MEHRRDPSQPDRRKDQNRRGGRRADDPQGTWISVSCYARLYGVNRRTVMAWLARDAQAFDEHERILDSYQVGVLIRIKNQPPKNQLKNKSGEVHRNTQLTG